ncbi:hypothetical protein PHLGIDRAFT_505418 [Phlebiopsis gigantea 11061_1 CR5-6]|uniref:DNA breaking-rejoining enzyme n=1 Tax=Phlebiopsis gigantea (strain 11061_1 CR5-6) TaxID=745531 RepID=A0A0C3PA77_PHLG1|nr:hypothetical protein PHLGIDRAFT_505418 [Phlebiopsis gigantea 11061_1 CR5-6]
MKSSTRRTYHAKCPNTSVFGLWTSTLWYLHSLTAGCLRLLVFFSRCDSVDIYTNKPKALGDEPSTYSHAQKMRAAMTHYFGRELDIGLGAWTESEVNPGRFLGNPSLSTVVGQYMISLRRKKTKAGEVVTSARAMEESVMRSLYTFNHRFPEMEFSRQSRKNKDFTHWAGRNVRMMLLLLYILAFMCLLRYDEALHIMWSDLVLSHVHGDIWRLEVRLPFRKTHQTGGIQPFFLYSNLEKPWLCPIRAYGAWVKVIKSLGMKPEGYVFRPRIGFDSMSSDPQEVMTSKSFLECFRNNLLDIGIDPRFYGTHSFRRGGCQWLSMVCRWSFRRICDWGGWAPTFDNPGTLFKYLLSWVDNPVERREDFFNPDRPQSDPCTHCGRTCLCA